MNEFEDPSLPVCCELDTVTTLMRGFIAKKSVRVYEVLKHQLLNYSRYCCGGH